MFGVMLVIMLVSIVMLLIGGVIGFFLGKSYGKEETEKKYAPAKEWEKKEAVSYERKEADTTKV